MKATLSRDRDPSPSVAPVLISAEPIPRHNGALHWSGASLGHGRPPNRVFIRHPRRSREFDGRRESAAFGDANRERCGKKSMKVTRSLVSVVDDDESVRESLPDLLKEFGFTARAFSSAQEFLASDCVGQTRCLILDIAMPGMTGPALQQELKLRRQQIPIVFITAQRDDAVRSRMLEQGAVECLFKPFSDTALLQALNAALRVN
jgi:CheY-like chemotaxis protein